MFGKYNFPITIFEVILNNVGNFNFKIFLKWLLPNVLQITILFIIHNVILEVNF